MNWEEFEKLTVGKCTFCEGELACSTNANHDRLIYSCTDCENTKYIFKNDTDKPLLYFFLLTKSGHVTGSRANATRDFLMSVDSANQHLSFQGKGVKAWLRSESDVKEKIDSLMVLK